MAEKDKMQDMQDASKNLDPIKEPKYVFDVEAFNKNKDKEIDTSAWDKQMFDPALSKDLKVSRPSRYKDTNVRATMYSPYEMEAVAATQQGWGEALANTGAGFFHQSRAGFLDFFAGNYDFEGMFNMAVGSPEAAAGNWLNDISKEIRDRAMKENPIFSTGEMSSKGYWLNQIQGLGYSGGLLVGGFADQIAMAALTGGTGNVATTGFKVKNALSMARNALQGFRSGFGEAYINGLHTAQEVRDKAIEAGLSIEEANEKAAKAATLGFRLEVGPLAALNSLQYMTMFGKAGSPFTRIDAPGFGVSDALGSVGEKLVGSSRLAKGAFNMASEAAEEVYQDGIGNYAKGEDFWQEGLIDSAIGGALGGILLPFMAKGMTGAFNKITGNGNNKEIQKQFEENRQSFEDNLINGHAKMFADRAKVNKEYTDAKEAMDADPSEKNKKAYEKASIKLANTNMDAQLLTATEAIRYDFEAGKGTVAFDAHVGFMEEAYNAVVNNDTETLMKFGLIDKSGNEVNPGTKEFIAQEYPGQIKQMKDFHKYTTDNLNGYTSDYNLATEKAAHQIKRDSFLEASKKSSQQEAILRDNDAMYNNLEPKTKEMLEAEIAAEALKIMGDETGSKYELAIAEKAASEISEEQKAFAHSIDTSKMVAGRVTALSTNKAAAEQAQILNDKYSNKNRETLLRERKEKLMEQKAKLTEQKKIIEEARKAAEAAQGKDKQEKESFFQKLKGKFTKRQKEAEIVANNKDTAEVVEETNNINKSLTSQAEIASKTGSIPTNKPIPGRVGGVGRQTSANTQAANTINNASNSQQSNPSVAGETVNGVQSNAEQSSQGTENVPNTASTESGNNIPEPNQSAPTPAQNGTEVKIPTGTTNIPAQNTEIPSGQQIVDESFPDADTDEATDGILDIFAGFSQSNDEDGFYSARESDAQKEKITEFVDTIVERLDEALGRETTFTDFIKNFIKKKGIQDTEANFDNLAKAWGISGRETGNVTSVKNLLFDTEASLISLMNSYVGESNAEENTKTQEEVTEVKKTETPKPELKELNDGRFEYDGQPYDMGVQDSSRTDSGQAKVAHIGHDYEETFDATVGKFVKTPIPKLVGTDGNNYILDPEVAREGTVLTAYIPEGEELANTIVTTWEYDKDTKRLKAVTQPFSSLGLQEGTPEYNAMVPILLKDANGNSLGYVHSPNWYNPNNVQSDGVRSVDEIMQEGVNNVLNIRSQVAQGNTEVIVTKKGIGNIYNVGRQSENNTLIPISQATGDTTMFVATNATTLENANGRADGMKFLNNFEKNPLRPGVIYDVRHIATEKDGTKVFIALASTPNLPSKGEDLNETAVNNVRASAMAAFLLANRDNPMVLEALEKEYGMTLIKAGNIQQEIRKTTGNMNLDITQPEHLFQYLRMFIPVSNSNSDFEGFMSNGVTAPGVYAVLDGKMLRFHNRTEKKAVDDPKTLKTPGLNLHANGVQTSEMLRLNIEAIDEIFNSEYGIVKKMPLSISKKQLGTNNSIAIFDDKGNITPSTQLYDDFVKDNLKTNIKSFQIETPDGSSKWITDVQPMVYIQSGVSKNVPAEVKTIVPETGIASNPATNEQANEALKTAEEAGIFAGFSQMSGAEEVTTLGNTEVPADDTSIGQDMFKGAEVPGDASTSEPAGDIPKAEEIKGTVEVIEREGEVFKETTITDTLATIESVDANLAESIREILPGLADLGDMNFFNSRRNLSEAQGLDNTILEALNNLIDKKIEGLTIIEQNKLTESIYNSILAEINLQGKKLNLNEVAARISTSVDVQMNAQINKYSDILNKLNAIEQQDANMQRIAKGIGTVIAKMNAVKTQKEKLVGMPKNVTDIKGVLVEKFEKFLSKSLREQKAAEDVQNNEDGVQQERSYDESAMERNVQQTFSTALNVFFAGIPKRDIKTGKESKNVFGLTDYVDSQDAVFALREILVDKPSSKQDVIDALAARATTSHLHKELLDKFQKADEKLQNEILYKLVQHQLSMFMVMYSRDAETGGISLKVMNSNSAQPEVVLKRNWLNNIKNSDLTKVVDGVRYYDLKRLQELEDKVLTLTNKVKKEGVKEVTPEMIAELDTLLRDMGIAVGRNTIEYLAGTPATYTDFTGNMGVLSLVSRNLRTAASKAEKQLLPVGESNPFQNASGQIEALTITETDLNGSRLTKAFRDSGKVIQGAVQSMMAKQLGNDLVNTESDYFQALLDDPFAQGNFVLDILANDAIARENYSVDFTALNVFKKSTDNNSDPKKVKDLADLDNTISRLGFFQNTDRVLQYQDPATGLRFRMTRMYNPAISDKEQMLLFKTPAIDINPHQIRDDGAIEDNVLAFVTKQLFGSELGRIITSMREGSTVKGYADTSKYFVGIPEINSQQYEADANVGPIDLIDSLHSFIQSNPQLSYQDLYQAAYAKYSPLATNAINTAIQVGVDNKIRKTPEGFKGSWVDQGFVKIARVLNKDTGVLEDVSVTSPYLDGMYLERKESSTGVRNTLSDSRRVQLLAYDFVINDMLNQSNVYQLYVGDMAFFGKGKKAYLYDKNVKDSPVDYIKMAKVVGENITKRMAMLIAPGNILADSKGDSYMQIMMNDPVSITSIARPLIEQFYGKFSEEDAVRLKEIEDADKVLSNTVSNPTEEQKKTYEEHSNKREAAVKYFKNKYAKIDAYFEIEGADAQEYTTWKEHLDILMRQGRLTTTQRKQLNTMYEKLSKGEELNAEELQIVMNPIKPVYTGRHPDRNANGQVSSIRTVYIKSSSFPLLPQLTRDFKLDEVRKKMEQLEKVSGKNVRLAYHTAVKVGGNMSKITVDDMYNKSFEELFQYDTDGDGVSSNFRGILADASSVLDRQYFRIQQDTPYKTEKFLNANSEDYTTMGSQIWKILMGGGINQKGAIFPNPFSPEIIRMVEREFYKQNPNSEPFGDIHDNGMLTGRQLDIIKGVIEHNLLSQIKGEFFKTLGIGKNGRPKDPKETLKALQKLLKEEISTGSYPESMLESLEIKKTPDGNFTFESPLWLSANTDKFEALLQSMVVNRLVRLKLPGNQLISASSEGFVKKTMDQLTEKERQGIIWADPSHTGGLKATRLVNGELHEAEVLVQSKFRKTIVDEKGNKTTVLIDLVKEGLVKKGEDGFMYLDLDKVDKDLLTNFSYRIPSSSHQSGAILKVVGFLPVESADMIVVPGEQTIQLGEDYDIDKRTMYRSNYTFNNGEIRKLGYDKNVDYNTPEGKEHNKKMYENILIDVYKSVYQTTDRDVQNKISQVLTFQVGEDTANLINNRIKGGESDRGFTLLNDDFQTAQMKLGADGKMGIGVHSNAVTLQSQMERVGEGTLTMMGEPDVKGKSYPRVVRLAGYTSDGSLGRTMTLDGRRSIADVHTENQNSATDNIKAQIMGKRNENMYTMGVLTQLAFRGFDQVEVTTIPGVETVQLGSLFISQPIIREYVKLMEENQSIVKEYNPKAEEEVIEKLLEKIGMKGIVVPGATPTVILPAIKEPDLITKDLTGDVLYSELLEETSTPINQAVILQLFLDLRKEAKQLGTLQKLMNLHSTGLGLSYFETLNRTQKRKDISLDGIAGIHGAFQLIKHNKEYTSEGRMLDMTLEAANAVMPLLFPYNSYGIKGSIEHVFAGRTYSATKDLEHKYNIMNGIRDYLYSGSNTLYEGSATEERYRLMFDTEDNTSLAKMVSIIRLKGSEEAKALFSTNPLLSSLNTRGINYDGSGPSILEMNPDQDGEHSRADKYNSFLELLQDDRTNLGTFNGEIMTPRKLAQDLATYAYVTGNNKATGFREMINMNYLKLVGFNEELRENSKEFRQLGEIKRAFTRQYMQHNPEMAVEISEKDFFGSVVKSFVPGTLEGFDVAGLTYTEVSEGNKSLIFNNVRAIPSKFIMEKALDSAVAQGINIEKNDVTFYKVKHGDNIMLFEYDYSLGMFVRLGLLGTKGMQEYDPKILYHSSLINNKGVSNTAMNYNKAIEISDSLGLTGNGIDELGGGQGGSGFQNIEKGFQDPLLEEAQKEFDTLLGGEPTVQSVLIGISESGSTYSELAGEILPYVKRGIKFELTDEVSAGRYSPGNDTIYISKDLATNMVETSKKTGIPVAQLIQEVLMEEIIHSTTVDILANYGDVKAKQYNPVGENIPPFVSRLAILFNEAQKALPDEYYTSNIAEFVAGSLLVDDFKNKLNSIEVDGKSLLTKIQEAFGAMIRYITNQSYDSAVVEDTMKLIKFRGVTTKKAETFTKDPKVNKPTNSVDSIIEGAGEFYNQLDTELQKGIKNIARPRLPSELVESNELDISQAQGFTESNMNAIINNMVVGNSLIVSSNPTKQDAQEAYLKGILDFIKTSTGIENPMDVIKVENLGKDKLKIVLTGDFYNDFFNSSIKNNLQTQAKQLLGNNIHKEAVMKYLEVQGIIQRDC